MTTVMKKFLLLLSLVALASADCTTSGFCQTCDSSVTLCDSGVGTRCEKLTGSIPSDNFCNLDSGEYCSAALAQIYTEQNFNSFVSAVEAAYDHCKADSNNRAECCQKGCVDKDCFCPTKCSGTKEVHGSGKSAASGQKLCFSYCTSCDGLAKSEEFCRDNCDNPSALFACEDDDECCDLIIPEECSEWDFRCVQPGDACRSGDCDPRDSFCDICKFGNECTDGRCPLSYDSMDCKSDDDCRGFLTDEAFGCEEGKCAKLEAYLGDGDLCNSSQDCYGTLSCSAGECVGKSANDTCEIDLECSRGHTCENTLSSSGRTCQPLAEENESCDSSDCALGLVCGSDKKCVPAYSKGENENCDDSLECKNNLVCADGKCRKPSSGGSCEKNGDCEDTDCECNRMEGQLECSRNYGFGTQGCEEAYNDAVDCVVDNECSYTMNQWTWKGTCLYTHCKDTYAAFMECVGGNSDELTACRSFATGSSNSLSSSSSTSSVGALDHWF